MPSPLVLSPKECQGKTWHPPVDLVAVGEKGIVTFDRDSGLEDPHGAGEPFFDDAGQMREAVACTKVITPWPEALQSQLGLALDDLHMIDERALSQLDDEAFLALRKAQALSIAYALNLSIPQTYLLARLARLNPGSVAATANLDDLFGDDDNELSFDFDS